MSASAIGGRTGSRSGEAVPVREPGHGLHQRAEPRPLPVWPSLAEPRNAHDDQAGVVRVQGLRRQPHLLQPAGDEVLDEHVRVPCQPPHECLPVGLPQTDRHALLVPAVRLPVGLDGAVAPSSQRVAVRQRLDLDRPRRRSPRAGGSACSRRRAATCRALADRLAGRGRRDRTALHESPFLRNTPLCDSSAPLSAEGWFSVYR